VSETAAWVVGDGDAGQRLDLFLARSLGSSRRRVQQLLAAGKVRVRGKPGRKGTLLRAGDDVCLRLDQPVGAVPPLPDPSLPLVVVHVDPQMVVVCKPPGMACHPLHGEGGTLAAALLARFPECGGAGGDPREAGLANRLDTGSSGLVVAARSPAAWQALRQSFHAARVEKTYLALVHGAAPAAGEISLPLGHHPRDRRRVVACSTAAEARRLSALPARTSFSTIERLCAFSLVGCKTAHGRMHQVRAHLAARGLPIVGDALYAGHDERLGNGRAGGDRLGDGRSGDEVRAGDQPAGGLPLIGHFLHAARLLLPRPFSGEILDLHAPLPEDREQTLGLLRAQGRAEPGSHRREDGDSGDDQGGGSG
jgi:23S rRNA pseudouridine1911/1915/1917 synthase